MNRTDVTEIERAVITLLARHKQLVYSADLSDWLDQLISTPEYQDSYPNNSHPDDNEGLYSTVTDEDERVYAEMIDEAACNLGHALSRYRQDGRKPGDYTAAIGSGFTITTSLAAAVAEFHEKVVNAFCVDN